ncbi:hypothetical protein [Pengzhenrongella frigida]|uniref:Uncharacterized protein n=1 Tax=Pengzhenrongella frigida TaxID=1259133 RepID=A0A4Q5MWA5_9MICO|nr:hypothetical protein [Cellulomonas sp. HLT2-17]RYV49825.1 hypothetical protein EUA98_16830 [Cellulomonas sp. HLT2-17]
MSVTVGAPRAAAPVTSAPATNGSVAGATDSDATTLSGATTFSGATTHGGAAAGGGSGTPVVCGAHEEVAVLRAAAGVLAAAVAGASGGRARTGRTC